jgi:hypothetical protein
MTRTFFCATWGPERTRLFSNARAVARLGTWITTSLLALSCHKKEVAKPDEQVPTTEGRATSRELLTKIGTARALQSKDKEAGNPSTAVKWTFVAPLDADSAVVGGQLPGVGVAVRTEDGGRSWTTVHTEDLDGASLITYSVGADKTLVISVARRQIPKKLVKGDIPPIDRLSLYFQSPGEKISAESRIFAPSEKDEGPLIPKGLGNQAVLSKTLSSFAVQMPGKKFGIAYGVPPSESNLPPITPLPNGESPIYAAYGRPPVLLTVNGHDLLARAWPAPGEALATPKPIEHVAVTKDLVDQLSGGPECESRGWSFKRIGQDPDKTFLLGVSKDKQVVLELPPSMDATKPIACNGDRVTVEAKDPTQNNEPALVTCAFDAGCQIPQNHAFLRPWADKHDRAIALTTTTKGVVAVQTMENQQQWTYLLGTSREAGKIYDNPRTVGEGKGERGRLGIGALIGLGDRTLMLVSADVTGTQSRAWYLMASDDGGESWAPP